MAAGDPFHDQIARRLAAKLDPDRFERCMGDLLRDDFPGLAPVVGGSDGGFDAAIPDGAAEPFPLACTTATRFADVKRNLLESLAAARKKEWFRERIALATSAQLAPKGRHELTAAVRDAGARLVQIFDRQAIADRLYGRPDWCKQLLDLAEQPRALSVVPESLRPQVAIELIGRQADLEWLRATSGDRLLLGQPGSGKTFLLKRIVDEGCAVFLLGAPLDAVAGALRERAPAAVIVDDADVHADRIDLLRRLREQHGYRFDIIATSWPSEADDVRQRMGGLTARQVRTLELLTRNEIVALFEQLGVRADDPVMRVLVTQAANKPGLAVAIARSWLEGDLDEIRTGEVLRRDVVASFEKRVGKSAEELLAAFALGGDGGMPIDVVAVYLGANEAGIRLAAHQLSAGGVLTDAAPRTMSVHPGPLRWALLRRVFFGGASTATLLPPVEQLLERAPRIDAAVLDVVRCVRSGGNVPAAWLRHLVERVHETTGRSVQVWQELALVDVESATWVVEHYPGDITDVGRQALETMAPNAISRLLRAAERAVGSVQNRLDHPLRIVSDWCRSFGRIDEPESLRRRRRLLDCVRRYSEGGGEPDVALHAGFLALDPSLQAHSLDPGRGDTFRMRWEILSADSVAVLADFWHEIQPLALAHPVVSWPHLSELLWSCAHPDSIHPTDVQGESRDALRSLGQIVLRDVTSMAEGHPGLAERLQEFAVALGCEVSLPRDPTFEALFPARDDAAAEEDDEAAREIVARWISQPVGDVARVVAYYDEEHRLFVQGRENRLSAVCREVARGVEKPEAWLRELLPDGPPVLIVPLVSRCVAAQREGAIAIVEQLLEHDSLAWLGAESALRLEHVPERLLARAFAAALRVPDLVESWCSRRAVPLGTVRRLLTSEHALLRIAAAVGEWLAEPRKQVEPSLREAWREAILRTRAQDLDTLRQSSSLEFWLGEILGDDPELSLAWLRALFPGVGLRLRLDGPVASAIDALTREHRVALIPALATLRLAIEPGAIPARVVGGDDEVYRHLLARADLRAVHLAPLLDPSRPEWTALARSALGAGYDACDVAASSLTPLERRGYDARRLERSRDAFVRIREDGPPELVDVAREGERLVREGLEKAAAEERQQALHGL